jgi:hypothetical protein
LEKHGDVVSRYFEANRFLDCDCGGLMRSLFEHGSEAEEFAVPGLIHDYFLLVFVDRGDPNPARDHYVGLAAGLSYLVDALTGTESLDLNLTRQDCGLVVVQQSKQRYAPQYVRLTSHGDLLCVRFVADSRSVLECEEESGSECEG